MYQESDNKLLIPQTEQQSAQIDFQLWRYTRYARIIQLLSEQWEELARSGNDIY